MQQFTEQTQNKTEHIATRKASQNCINILAQQLPELIGGSADLTGSNLTLWSAATTLSAENPGGNYLYYGVREFGMSAIMCGIALHGGFIPFGGTFLTFVDYARNAIRMAALMKQRVIFVYTHDSIGLGEDGPTHQPIEHIGMLRLTPQVSLWRPCDAVESAVAWQMAIAKQDGPTCLLFSRQGLPQQSRDKQTLENIHRGGYILKECEGQPDAILIATGSEVSLAVESGKILEEQGKNIRIVSMPSTDVFDHQSAEYRQKVLPNQITARVAIEAGAKDIWYKYVGLAGKIVGLNRFGESAPAPQVYQELGITKEAIVQAVKELINKN
jgi:transketolase